MTCPRVTEVTQLSLINTEVPTWEDVSAGRSWRRHPDSFDSEPSHKSPSHKSSILHTTTSHIYMPVATSALAFFLCQYSRMDCK
jgi:hypothetical protein